MKSYIIFNDTGRILRTGVCQDHMLERQAQPGEQVMEGEASDVTQRIDINTKQIVDKNADH